MIKNKMGTSFKDFSLIAPIIETKNRLKNKKDIVKIIEWGEKKRIANNKKLNIVNIEGMVWINFIILESLLPKLILATPEL